MTSARIPHLISITLALAMNGAYADTTNVSVPSTASKGVKETVQSAWPKVLNACPGLKKYSNDLSFAGVEDNYSYAPPMQKGSK